MKKDEIAYKLGLLKAQIDNLTEHFNNHLHNHKFDKILNTIYFLLTVAMFCYLKWGV